MAERRARAEWSGSEIATLKEIYPTQGAKICAKALPQRSIGAIYMAAWYLGIARIGKRRGRRAAPR